MKPTKMLWIMAVCAALAACLAPADPSAATAAANKALVERFYRDVFIDWDRELVAELLSPVFRSHDWPVDARTGPDGFWDFYDGVLQSFPDTRYVVDDLIAEGDRVVVHWRLLATQQGEFFGMAPTDAPISLQGIAIYRVEGGKLMERWVVYDLYGLIEQVKTAAEKGDQD